jgi:mono/diheme cytochrome c family protein
MIWLIETGLILFALGGLIILAGGLAKKPLWKEIGALIASIMGPLTLACCWFVLLHFRQNETVYWARLMAGDAAERFAMGSLGLIVGSGLAVGVLSLEDRFASLRAGAIFLALSWIFLFLHPTPHYVPFPGWFDKLVWFMVLVGGAGICVVVFRKLKDRLRPFSVPLFILAGVFPLLSLVTFAAHRQAQVFLDLGSMPMEQRVSMMGCLVCHSMNGEGQPNPGGGLEAVASRREDELREFLLEPTEQNAKQFNIRENPTGDMAGVHLTPGQVNALMEVLSAVYGFRQAVSENVSMEGVESILTAKTCLACHSVGDRGAAGGGVGGPLEDAAKLSREALRAWLLNPSMDNAKQLGIRENPIGAMGNFALTEEEAEVIVPWVLSLEEK